MSRAEDGESTGLIDPKWKIAPGMMPQPGQMYHFEGTFALPEKLEGGNGVVGNPTKATREKGEILVNRVVDHVSELIDEIMTKYPVGTKPQTA
jgi:creatinine amidohydrolase